MAGTEADARALLSAKAVRERCARVYAEAQAGRTHFAIRPERMTEVAAYVAEVTRATYPDLKVPYHSRWGHLQAGGVDRLKDLESRLAGLSPLERLKAKIDFVVISVLLDAGSGAAWKFRDHGVEIGRSEGLAVASYGLFVGGLLSAQAPRHPYRVDGSVLATLPETVLAAAFQVSPKNPLEGFEGRLSLMHSLGRHLAARKDLFAEGRPGDIADHVIAAAGSGEVGAPVILREVLTGLGAIWPGRVSVAGTNLGDAWLYSPLGVGLESLVPFHKLSQWLTYSLVEPFQEYGLKVVDLDGLTPLPEYRNGGLLLDQGLIELRDPKMKDVAHEPSSALIVEWRALTIALIDALAVEVRKQLKVDAKQFPLMCVLEGGTWRAGRKTAAAKRSDASPPLKIVSDGTVF